MRVLLQASIPAKEGNEHVRKGTLGSTIQKILDELKPEAAYFVANDDGERSAFLVLDMKESSDLPRLAEPFFLAFNARVHVRPTMTPQDLAAAAPHIEKAAKAY